MTGGTGARHRHPGEQARVNVILGMLGEARDLNDQELLDYIDDLDDHEA